MPRDDGPPVVRLVVDDPVGDAVRLLLPGPHEGRAVAGGVGEDGVERLAGRDARPDALEGAGQRVDGRRLDGVDPRAARRAPPVGVSPAGDGREQRPAADLDDEPVEAGRAARAPTAAASSQPSVSPPSIARPLRLPWQVNGTAPASSARRSAWYGRVAGDAGLALADGAGRAPRARRRSTTTGIGVGRDEDVEVAAGGPGDDRGGEGGVAAGGDRERRASAAGRPPSGRRAAAPRARAAVPRRPRDDAPPPPPAPGASRRGGGALCEPDDVAGLVLDPDPAAGGEAQGVGQRVRSAANGVTRNPWPSTAATAGVEPLDEARRSRRRSSPSRGPVVGVEQRAPADERVGSPPASAGKRDGRRPGRARGRARGRRRRRAGPPGRRRRAARRPGRGCPQPAQTSAVGRADDGPGRPRPPARGPGHASTPTPARAFISRSPRPRPGRSPAASRQKAWSRRATKSANGTPCCSTQVK